MSDGHDSAGAQPREGSVAWVHVKARTPTALRLETGQIHDLGMVEVSVSNWIQEDAAGPVHRGLFFDSRARGQTYRSALDLAMRAADGVMSSLSFASATGSGPLEPLAIFNDVPGGCHVRQFLELPLGPSVARVLESARTEWILSAVDQLPPARRDRIFTAMSWYRKAALEPQPIDAFTAGWLGLETLNALLAEHYGVRNERTVRTCQACGASVVTSPTSAGIRELLIEVGGADLWNAAHRRRIALLHATTPLAEVHDDLKNLARQITRGLRKGVMLLGGLNDDGREPTPMGVPRQHRARVDLFLPDYAVAMVPIGPRHPRVRVRSLKSAKRLVENGRTIESAETQWEVVDFDGPKYKAEWKIEPDQDPDDASASAEMRFLGQEASPDG